MRRSALFLPTERQPPADAEALSHKLMVRAGLVRQLGAGLWSWLPAGWRVHQKVVQIIREEIDAIGGQELLLPVMHPRELWRKTGRDQIEELFTLEDRKGAEMVLAMTHEEAVTFHVGAAVKSYRDLPKTLYHFQVKERDEARPRAGILRTREFIMKDSYSFDRDEAGLDVQYEAHRGAYAKIYDRTGLEWFECRSDVGMMGGTVAHEYMAPCPAGEDDVVLARGYASNLEVASADPQPVELPGDTEAAEVTTPGATTVEALTASLGLPAGALLKAYPVIAEDDGRLVLVMVRGDHRVNPVKLQNALRSPFRPAGTEEIAAQVGPAGYIGPHAPLTAVETLYDAAIEAGPYVVGANRADTHLRGFVVPEGATRADVRLVEPGDTIGGEPVRIVTAIEIGNIFKLGTRYSEPLGATYLDADGKPQKIVMGSYGIGPARIAAAAVEQFADEKGISWPVAIAPWTVNLVSLGKGGTPERAAADALYEQLRAAGVEVLYDDRDTGNGEKFAEAELLGCPLRITLGKRSLDSGLLEAQIRRELQDVEGGIPLEGAVGAVLGILPTLA
ncbi:proline--tRNA ligase [Paraconexibacter antarcticus]|uniref:Proline--tRNA ligase n=1 Tax=Paraconexibacter antarcticus TaxID=2949664 RepID=A0ABY5DLV8_9ACTN|nr:proline--tRNA ligase [Paraconexibacter antarcticus]UTI62871.1 proline--tRNA ligase [Paraconexibacter antarcticus]